MDSSEHINWDKKKCIVVPDPKLQNVSMIKESDNKSNGYHEGTNNSSENI